MDAGRFVAAANIGRLSGHVRCQPTRTSRTSNANGYFVIAHCQRNDAPWHDDDAPWHDDDARCHPGSQGSRLCFSNDDPHRNHHAYSDAHQLAKHSNTNNWANCYRDTTPHRHTSSNRHTFAHSDGQTHVS
jgi:hypothetical protein